VPAIVEKGWARTALASASEVGRALETEAMMMPRMMGRKSGRA